MGGRVATGALALGLVLAACGPAAGSSGQPSAPAAPVARLGAVFVADPAHHDLLLFGGRADRGVLADTWLWARGGGWRRVAPTAPPPARSFAGAAADGRGGVLLFGGDPSDPTGTHDDTWRWDGARWTALHPRTVPDDGAYRAMAPGPDGAPVLVVFGADRAVHTWTWRGADWVRASGTVTPPWLDDAAPVPDRASGRLLLAGGIPEPGSTRLDGTWAWDGAAWSELRPAHQPAGGPAAAADLATGPLLYEQDGTWTWSGGDWTLAQPAGVPRWQAYSALAAVPGAGPGDVLAVLLTGAAGGPGQTWRWNGFGWTPG